MKVKTLQKIWIYFVLLNIIVLLNFCKLYFDKLTLAYKQMDLAWNMILKIKPIKLLFLFTIFNITRILWSASNSSLGD